MKESEAKERTRVLIESVTGTKRRMPDHRAPLLCQVQNLMKDHSDGRHLTAFLLPTEVTHPSVTENTAVP